MREKKGMFASLFGKKETKGAETEGAIARPEEESIRPLHETECCCPFCGEVLAPERTNCPVCGKEQPWYLKEV